MSEVAQRTRCAASGRQSRRNGFVRHSILLVAGVSMWQGMHFLWVFMWKMERTASGKTDGWHVVRQLWEEVCALCLCMRGRHANTTSMRAKERCFMAGMTTKKCDTYHVRCLDVVVSHFHSCTSDEHRTSSHPAVVWAQAFGSTQLISTLPILHKVTSGFVTRDLPRGRQLINQTFYLLIESYKCYKIMIIATPPRGLATLVVVRGPSTCQDSHLTGKRGASQGSPLRVAPGVP